MNVRELIDQLKEFPQDLQIYVRYQDPLGESDYWNLTGPDIRNGEVEDSKTGKEHLAVLIGDDRV